MNMRKLIGLAAICVVAASPSLAGLVAKWDFDNYDSENPTSAAILAPTVGSLAAIPCTGTSPMSQTGPRSTGASLRTSVIHLPRISGHLVQSPP
jgi:fructose-specific phosphotransferase system IIC component